MGERVLGNTVDVLDAVITRRDDGILEVRHKPGSVQTGDSARAQLQEMSDLMGGSIPVPVLVFPGTMKGQTAEARRYLSQEQEVADVIGMCAMIIETPISRVIASVFLGINKPLMPFKVFKSEKEAVAWLKEG